MLLGFDSKDWLGKVCVLTATIRALICSGQQLIRSTFQFIFHMQMSKR
jgi:hypothetical protein